MDNFDGLDKDQRQRLSALIHLDAGRLTSKQVAERLQVTQRQVWRLLQAYRAMGPQIAVHGNHGRQPANRVDEVTRNRVLTFATGKYRDFNDHQLTEFLNPSSSTRPRE